MNAARRLPGYLPLLVATFLSVSWPAWTVRAATTGDAFTVAGIRVDATATSAVAAREAARVDGERRAFRTLLERLTLAADRSRLPRLADQRLTEMVRDFEVANERSSAVRYLADYTFRFRAEDVRRLLREAGIPFAETASKPVVVLAVLRRGDATLLWDGMNPWRDAWASRKAASGLVPFVMPLGDASDVAAIDADQALAADAAALATIAARYRGGDTMVAAATQLPTGELQTTLRRASAGAGGEISTAVFQPNADESEVDFMARAAAASADAVEEAWKRDNLLDIGKEAVLLAEVPLSGIGDWLFVRERLNGIAAIKRGDLVGLGRQVARVEIHYLGDPARLRLALAQRDLVLGGGEGAWTLQPRPGSAPSR